MKRLLPVICLLILCACHKQDVTAPVITVISPTDNQTAAGGQTVNIKATISDNSSIHMVHVTVTDNSTGGHLVHFEEHLDGKSYTLNNSFIPQTGRSYLIEIGAVDHDNNSSSKEITVTGN